MTRVANYNGLVSDNSSFAAYGVPNVNLIFMNPYQAYDVHYANHLHDPYDSSGLARLESDAFVDMATIMLSAALATGADNPDLRATPPPDRRALFVGSHTEGIHMSPAGLVGLGMALVWEGLDVDMVPYGQAVTPDDLAGTDLVVALPVHDYPSPDYEPTPYDEAWTPAELDALESYVAAGGLLVLTNSDRRLKYLNLAYDGNEDWPDVNARAERFGVPYLAGLFATTTATVTGSHPLVEDLSSLWMIDGNGTGSPPRTARRWRWSAAPLPSPSCRTALARWWCWPTSACSGRTRIPRPTGGSGPTSPPTRAERSGRTRARPALRCAERPARVRAGGRLSNRRADAIVVLECPVPVPEPAQRTMEG
jgi:hypothetical protein